MMLNVDIALYLAERLPPRYMISAESGVVRVVNTQTDADYLCAGGTPQHVLAAVLHWIEAGEPPAREVLAA